MTVPDMTTNLHREIGQHIAAACARCKITREQLAANTGLTVTRIVQIEAGEVPATAAELMTIAEELNVTVAALCTGLDR